MLSQQLYKEQRILQAELLERSKGGDLKTISDSVPPTKRRRWDQSSVNSNGDVKGADTPSDTPGSVGKRWGDDSLTPSRPSATPGNAATPGSRSQWEETPGRLRDPGATPGQSVRQWAETPAHLAGATTPGRDMLGAGVAGVRSVVYFYFLAYEFLIINLTHLRLFCRVRLVLDVIAGMRHHTLNVMVQTLLVMELGGLKLLKLIGHLVGLNPFKIHQIHCMHHHLHRVLLLQLL